MSAVALRGIWFKRLRSRNYNLRVHWQWISIFFRDWSPLHILQYKRLFVAKTADAYICCFYVLLLCTTNL